MNDSRTPFGDRLDALADEATHGVQLRHPPSAAAARAPRRGQLAWATVAVLVVLGGLTWWQIGDGNDASSGDAVVANGSDATDSREPGTDDGTAQPCHIDPVIELLQSGLPTYDYEPAGSYRAAADQAQLVVIGTVSEARRTEPIPEQADSIAFTELSVSDVTTLDGTPVADVSPIAYNSWWADRNAVDPLAETVALQGVRFVGFLSPWSGIRGGYSPGVEGLYVACGTDTPATAVIASAAGRDEPTRPTLDELVAMLTPATPEPIECAEPGGLQLLADLIDPGFDFDFQPAGSIAALAGQVDEVIIGELTAVRRVLNDGPLPDEAFTVLTVDNIGTIDGSPTTIEGIGMASVPPSSGAQDALDPGVTVTGVEVVAFVYRDPRVPGGAIPAVEGLYLGCGRTTPVIAVVESAVGPDDPADPTIDDLLSMAGDPIVDPSDPAASFTAEEAGYVRDAIVQFATGEALAIEEIPLAQEVALALGSDIERVATNVELRDPAAWSIDRPEGYAEFSGPFSALDVLAGGPTTSVTLGEHPHCAGDPIAAPAGFEDLTRISIQPAEGTIDSCIAWFAVDVFYDLDTGTIQAISLALFGP